MLYYVMLWYRSYVIYVKLAIDVMLCDSIHIILRYVISAMLCYLCYVMLSMVWYVRYGIYAMLYM